MAKKKKIEGQMSLDFSANSPQGELPKFEPLTIFRSADVTSLEEARRLKMREMLVSNLRESGLLSLRKA